MEPNMMTNTTKSMDSGARGITFEYALQWLNRNPYIYAGAGTIAVILVAAISIIFCTKKKPVGYSEPEEEMSNNEDETPFSTVEAARSKTANIKDTLTLKHTSRTQWSYMPFN